MLVKALKNNIADFVEDLNSFLASFKDLIIQTMSKIGAIFVEELVKQIKKNIKRLVQNIMIDIIKESKDAKIRIITSLIATALTVAQLVRDYRRCKSVIDELIYLLKIIRANVGGSGRNLNGSGLPTFSLALSSGLPGMSQTRAFANIIEGMQNSGMISPREGRRAMKKAIKEMRQASKDKLSGMREASRDLDREERMTNKAARFENRMQRKSDRINDRFDRKAERSIQEITGEDGKASRCARG